MARRNTLRLDTSGFVRILQELDDLGGDVKQVTEDALRPAAEKIVHDTKAAMAHANLPAGGKYSDGTTEESIVTGKQVEWEGLVASVPVGFDFSKPGAGGYLITGTPRMSPDRQLNRMYKQRAYMNRIQKEMGDVAMKALMDKMTEG
jgi:hypothetical protein